MKDIIYQNELAKIMQKELCEKEKDDDKKIMQLYDQILGKQDEERKKFFKTIEIKQKQSLDRNLKIVANEKEIQMALLDKLNDKYEKEKDQKYFIKIIFYK